LAFPGELSISILLELSLHFLPLLLDDIDWVAAFAIAELAAVRRESCSPLSLWNLAKATFTRF
jgi:hypothetical protein